tara:strand:- start:111 stop:317 length:207 start_codon:yes stop_codon:yes gene_type:complete
MYNQDALLEYLSSPAGINKVILGIIIVAAINFGFLFYTVRKTYGATIKEKERMRIQKDKIAKLSPKKQ